MEPRLSALQQRDVWEGWLSAEVRAYYFADLRQRCERHQQLTTWFTLAASSGAAVTLLGMFAETAAWIPAVLATAAAGLSLWSLVAQHASRAGACSDLHAAWARLAHQYRALWDDMYADDAPARLARLLDDEVELGRRSDALPNKRHLVAKWEDHVVLHRASIAQA